MKHYLYECTDPDSECDDDGVYRVGGFEVTKIIFRSN